MSLSRPSPIPSRIKLGALGIGVCLIALLPWWHNHGYLRDFYDYGLFINVNARLAEGQHPYTDFTTPAQSAAFLLNYAAETVGGGTYLGLTRGAAALIIVGGLGLTFMLARRFNAWVAALLALAIVTGSASQHTILFYNPLGVLAMALVVWSFAVAPLLRRETLGWHLLAAAGLVLGGTNKINFHLLACAMAGGWMLHAWFVQKAALPRGLLTAAFLVFFGLVLPIGLEIAWTGAGWERWFYNVVQLPLSARGGRMSQLLSPDLYLHTVHGYYGELRVPQVGLIGVLLPVLAIVVGLRAGPAENRGARRLFLVLAGLLAAFGGAALLLTNNEIAYVTFAAILVIAIGLWLGFGLQPRGGWFVAGLLLPALLLAAAGWDSAWRGQRSQFGHDRSPRAEYAHGEQAGADFGYIRGLHVPSALVSSLEDLAKWRRALPGDEATRIFYGPGVEWLEHVWPARKVPGLPLIAAAFDGRRESDLLLREVIGGDTFRHIVVLEAWDYWTDEVMDRLAHTTLKQRVGPSLMVYFKLNPQVLSARPLEFLLGGLGSNVDSLRTLTALPQLGLADGRRYLGLDHGTGRIDVDTPCSRMSAEYVLVRAQPTHPGPLTVQLAIYANMSGGLLPRWSGDVTLPAGVDELVVRTDQVDGSSLPLTFTVTIPEAAAGLVRAGWRGFQLTDTVDRDVAPPMLQSGVRPFTTPWDGFRLALLPPSLLQTQAYVRSATLENGAVVLRAGGEIWVKMDGLYTDVKILTAMLEPQPGATPRLQVVYYKGGRMERFVPVFDSAAGTARFTAWSAEYGGWIGILTPLDTGLPGITVKIEAATRH